MNFSFTLLFAWLFLSWVLHTHAQLLTIQQTGNFSTDPGLSFFLADQDFGTDMASTFFNGGNSLLIGFPGFGGATGAVVLAFFNDAVSNQPQIDRVTVYANGRSGFGIFGTTLANGDEFGTSVAVFGGSRFAFGAPGRNSVFIAEPSFPDGILTDAVIAPLVLTGSPSFGAAVFAEDLNNDNQDELIVGAPDSNEVFIYFFSPSGTVLLFQTLSPPDMSTNARFGTSFNILEDFSGDSIPELLVGADNFNGGQGAIYLIVLAVTSNSSISITDHVIIGNEALGDVLFGISHFGGRITRSPAAFDNTGRNGIIVTSGPQIGSVGLNFPSFYYLVLQNSIANTVTDSTIFTLQETFPDAFPFSLIRTFHYSEFPGFAGFIFTDVNEFATNDIFQLYTLLFTTCGDGVIGNTNEECDDGNALTQDGCDNTCRVEQFWSCSGQPSVCVGICGDGIIAGNDCDDNNTQVGDGCDEFCQVEAGFECQSEPSVCLRNGSTDNNIIIASIVIISIVCCCLIPAVIVGSLLVWKKNKKTASIIQLSVLSENEIPHLKNVTVGEVIGNGNFGQVRKGHWQGIDIALKQLKGSDVEEFANELKIMSQAKHTNVVSFFGVYLSEHDTFLVSEFMEQGDLLTLLHKNIEITNKQLIEMCRNVANGVGYLHSIKIIHRDLACRNLLVSGTSEKYLVKVADFGLSRIVENYYITESRKIPIRWTAPEAIQFLKFDQASDVWSFGIVLWEIFSRGSVPYPGLSNEQVIQKIKSDFRLPAPFGMPDSIIHLMKDCWKIRPSERPNFEMIIEGLANDCESSTAYSPSSIGEISPNLKQKATRASGYVEDYGVYNSEARVQIQSEVESLKQENLKLKEQLTNLQQVKLKLETVVQEKDEIIKSLSK